MYVIYFQSRANLPKIQSDQLGVQAFLLVLFLMIPRWTKIVQVDAWSRNCLLDGCQYYCAFSFCFAKIFVVVVSRLLTPIHQM
uniref:Uncharacterized protein n=1 Tax=Ditylenchus dipsaci TaxID=166011 RepID=A0A915EMH3_9BILA